MKNGRKFGNWSVFIFKPLSAEDFLKKGIFKDLWCIEVSMSFVKALRGSQKLGRKFGIWSFFFI